MPITKQALKKQRHDRVRASHNKRVRETLRDVIKAMRRHPSAKALTAAYKKLDKAAKTNIMHKNKASRLKSRLSRLLKKS